MIVLNDFEELNKQIWETIEIDLNKIHDPMIKNIEVSSFILI